MTYLWSCGRNNYFYMVCVWMACVMLAASLDVLGLYLWTYEHVGVVWDIRGGFDSCQNPCSSAPPPRGAHSPHPSTCPLPEAMLCSGATGTTSSQKRSVWLSSHLLPTPLPPINPIICLFFQDSPGPSPCRCRVSSMANLAVVNLWRAAVNCCLTCFLPDGILKTSRVLVQGISSCSISWITTLRWNTDNGIQKVIKSYLLKKKTVSLNITFI